MKRIIKHEASFTRLVWMYVVLSVSPVVVHQPDYLLNQSSLIYVHGQNYVSTINVVDRPSWPPYLCTIANVIPLSR